MLNLLLVKRELLDVDKVQEGVAVGRDCLSLLCPCKAPFGVLAYRPGAQAQGCRAVEWVMRKIRGVEHLSYK